MALDFEKNKFEVFFFFSLLLSFFVPRRLWDAVFFFFFLEGCLFYFLSFFNQAFPFPFASFFSGSVFFFLLRQVIFKMIEVGMSHFLFFCKSRTSNSKAQNFKLKKRRISKSTVQNSISIGCFFFFIFFFIIYIYIYLATRTCRAPCTPWRGRRRPRDPESAPRWRVSPCHHRT
jgi:hypothetical protein